MRKIAIALVLMLVVLAGVAYYFYSNAGGIIKTAIERYGSEATQSAVRLSGVKLSLTTGEGSLDGLRIANPAGYSSGDALDLGSIGVAVDPKSALGSGPIIIHDVTIDSPAVAYEQGPSGSNLDALRKNVSAYAKGLTGSPSSGGGTSPAQSGEGRKIIIDNLYVRNGKVSVSSPLLQGQGVTADLPVIHLSNIGRAKGGATQAEIAQQVLGVITSTAIETGAGALTKQLGNLGGVAGKIPGGGGALKGLFH